MALTFFPRENLLIAKNQCHFPREKNQCHSWIFRQIDGIFQFSTTFYGIIKQFDEIFTIFVKNYVEIILHDHFSRCIEIPNPLGSFFIPRGFTYPVHRLWYCRLNYVKHENLLLVLTDVCLCFIHFFSKIFVKTLCTFVKTLCTFVKTFCTFVKTLLNLYL